MHTRTSETDIERRHPRAHDGDGHRAPARAREEIGAHRTELERELEAAQIEFVDDPRGAVARAERVVDRMLRDLTERLGRMRASTGADTDDAEGTTERLRLALQHYRALAQRLIDIPGV